MENPVFLHGKKFELFITRDQIDSRVNSLAKEIEQAIQDPLPVFLPVLNGSFIFAADLLRRIHSPCEICFVKLSSYKDTQSTGEVEMPLDIQKSLQDRTVIIVEDIADSGLTLEFLTHRLNEQKPESVQTVSLLYKPEAFQPEQKPEFTGFSIPNDFVVGYGLDYEGLGRNLPDIYRLSE